MSKRKRDRIDDLVDIVKSGDWPQEGVKVMSLYLDIAIAHDEPITDGGAANVQRANIHASLIWTTATMATKALAARFDDQMDDETKDTLRDSIALYCAARMQALATAKAIGLPTDALIDAVGKCGAAIATDMGRMMERHGKERGA